MNEPKRPTGGRKLLALFGAASVVGLALYTSRDPLPVTAAAAAADEPKDKPPTAPTPRAVDAANAFLAALDAKQREAAALEFGSAKKPNWSNFPTSFTPRNGVKLDDLTAEQRAKAMAVVAAVLSKDGYQKVIDIMDGDQKLLDNPGKGGGKGGGKGPLFGKDLYYLAIFGAPSEAKPWMVQFGGHHLGVNVTVVGKHFVLTPTHTGAQPGAFKRGEAEVRPLGRESDAAYKLMDSLDEKQRKAAVIGDRSQDLVLGPGRDGKTVEVKGLKGADLSKDQQALLLDVIAAWVTIAEADAAAERLAAIKEKIGETHFAWSGPVEKGKAAYFRVHGPNVIIEYAPQGGTDHIHTVIRNPEDEYGAGSIKR